MKLLAVSLLCKLKRDAQSEPSYQSVLDLRTVGHILRGKGGLLESCESEILRQGDPQMAEVLFLQTGGVLFTRWLVGSPGWPGLVNMRGKKLIVLSQGHVSILI